MRRRGGRGGGEEEQLSSSALTDTLAIQVTRRSICYHCYCYSFRPRFLRVTFPFSGSVRAMMSHPLGMALPIIACLHVRMLECSFVPPCVVCSAIHLRLHRHPRPPGNSQPCRYTRGVFAFCLSHAGTLSACFVSAAARGRVAGGAPVRVSVRFPWRGVPQPSLPLRPQRRGAVEG